MLEGFDALPEVLRPIAHAPRRLPSRTHPRSRSAPALVDCAVYAEGQRMPGTFTYDAALVKVRQIELLGHEAFVWVGLARAGSKPRCRK